MLLMVGGRLREAVIDEASFLTKEARAASTFTSGGDGSRSISVINVLAVASLITIVGEVCSVATGSGAISGAGNAFGLGFVISVRSTGIP